MKKVFTIVSLMMIVIISCSPTEPTEEELTLTIEDVSSTEAWLKVSKINTAAPVNVSISRNETEIYNFTLAANDTVLYDEGLLPNKTYNYDASIKPSSRTTSVTATTIDTTSHNM